MGFGLITAGFAFLFNPCFNLIDFLPDFIGFYLIFKGLSKISTMDDDLGDARYTFCHLFLIDLSKILVLYLLVAGRGGSTVGPDGSMLDALSMKAASQTYVLIAVFVYAIIEIIYFTSGVTKLFAGLDGLARRFPSKSINAVVTSPRGGKAPRVRDFSSTVRSVTVVFFVVRSAFSVVAELPALFMSSRYGDVTMNAVNAETARPLLNVSNALFVTAFGVVYLYYALRFFVSVKKDREFIDAVRAAYSSFSEENPTVTLGRRMRLAAVCFMASAFLSVRITNSEKAIVPGVFCAAMIIMTAIVLKNACCEKRSWLLIVIPSALYAVMSVVSFIIEDGFFSQYSRFDVFRFAGARRLYPAVAVIEEISFVLLAFSMICLSVVFYRTIRSNVPLSGADLYVSDNATKRLDLYRKELDASIRKRTRICLIGGIVHFSLLIVSPIVEPLIPVVFPAVTEAGREIDVPGQVMSYAAFFYFFVAAAWIVANLVLCVFSNSEMYRPMAENEK